MGCCGGGYNYNKHNHEEKGEQRKDNDRRIIPVLLIGIVAILIYFVLK